MRSVLAAGPVPRYLSATAASLLSEARAAYARYQLAEHMILRDGADTVLFPWAGSRVTQTLAAQLTAAGLDASNDGLVITVLKAEPGQVRERLKALVEAGPADPVSLAARVRTRQPPSTTTGSRTACCPLTMPAVHLTARAHGGRRACCLVADDQ